MQVPRVAVLRGPWFISIALTLAFGGALAASASSGTRPGASSGPIEATAPASEERVQATPFQGVRPALNSTTDPSDESAGAATAEDPEPSGAEHAVSRLVAAGIPTTLAAFTEIADQVGVGGAVRAFAFAKESGKTPTEIVAMFSGGMGWGQIAKTLDLSVGPGIGWIMGNGNAKPGKENRGAGKGSKPNKP